MFSGHIPRYETLAYSKDQIYVIFEEDLNDADKLVEDWNVMDLTFSNAVKVDKIILMNWMICMY